MKVKLLSITNNAIEVMFLAARTCYSVEGPILMSDKTIVLENAEKLIKQVLNSGHQSIAEHINLTFAIEGISRSCSHQLVRHRHCTFSQQSQRYVEIKEDIEYLSNLESTGEVASLEEILNKYFIFNNIDTMWSCFKSLKDYLILVEKGYKPEDARQVLSNCTKTNLVMTCNLRELMHICNLRLCSRAQTEIRALFNEIKKNITEQNEFIGNLLIPNCEVNGFCTEHKCCGRRPKREENS